MIEIMLACIICLMLVGFCFIKYLTNVIERCAKDLHAMEGILRREERRKVVKL